MFLIKSGTLITKMEIYSWNTQNHLLLAYFPYLKKLSGPIISRCCLSVCVSVYPPVVARQRLGKSPLIVARQLLGKNPRSLLVNGSVKMFLSLLGNGSVKIPIVARQRLGRTVTAVTNTHAIIEELLDA
jgi:hypothetical protein